MIFKCLTWNTAKRLKLLDDQFEFIVQTQHDFFAKYFKEKIGLTIHDGGGVRP